MEVVSAGLQDLFLSVLYTLITGVAVMLAVKLYRFIDVQYQRMLASLDDDKARIVRGVVDTAVNAVEQMFASGQIDANDRLKTAVGIVQDAARARNWDRIADAEINAYIEEAVRNYKKSVNETPATPEA